MKNELFNGLAVDTAYEFCTVDSSFVGKFVEQDDDNVVFKDVVKTVISMMPIQNNEGQQEIRPVPKMEIMNFYTTADEFVFPKSAITYCAKMEFQVFTQAYEETINMYSQMKVQSGTNLTIPTVDEVNNIAN